MHRDDVNKKGSTGAVTGGLTRRERLELCSKLVLRDIVREQLLLKSDWVDVARAVYPDRHLWKYIKNARRTTAPTKAVLPYRARVARVRQK